MITKISLIDNIDEEEEKKKKLLGSNFGGGWGISDLVKPEKETEEEKPFKIAKIKPITEPVEIPSSQYGISELNKPEQMGKIQKGIIGVFGTWEAKKKANPELQNVEDFGNEVFKQGDERNQIAYIQEALTGTSKEETLKELQANWDKFKDINPDIDERTWKEYYGEEGLWKTLITGPSKGKYDEAIKLRNQLIDIAQKVAEPGKDIIGQLGWSGMVAILGTEAVAGIMSVSPIIKEKLLNKTIKTNVSTEKSFKALQDISGRGGTAEQMKLFRTIVEQAKAKGVSVSDVIRKGVTTTETVPRFAFAGKLYAGLPADEIAKSIIEVGKVTAEAVKGLDPVKVSQVTQQLLATSPALASEFLKAVEKPEGIPDKSELIETLKAKGFEGTIDRLNRGELTEEQARAELGGDISNIPKVDMDAVDPLEGALGLTWEQIKAKQQGKPVRKVLTPPAEPKEVLKAEGKEPDKLFKDIDAYTKTEEGHEFKVMRSGEEYSQPSRGGTWYEIETWEGKKSAYLEGQGQYGLPGVGGKTTIRKELVFKNPYMFKIPETKAEGETPIKLWEEVEGKVLPNKKGFLGKDAEKHFAKLEKEVSDTLKEKGYDGVILYEKVGVNTYPKQIFDLKTQPKPTTITPAPTVEPTAVKKEAVTEPTPKATPKAPAIPAELEGLAEEARKYKSAEEFKKAVSKVMAKKNQFGGLSDSAFIARLTKSEKSLSNAHIEGKLGLHQLTDFYTQATATPTTEQKAVVEPVAEKATAEPTKAEAIPEVKAEVELATPAQINKAYSIAKSKAMVSEEGKLKPQFRKIAEIFTDVKYIEKMTPEQAEMFIDQLNRLPEPKYRNGKLVPPSIPTTTKLTIQGFFQKRYGEPTPIWLLTDQTYYATKLGIKPLVAPFEKGKQEFDLEFRKSSNLVDRMVNKLNQVAKTPGWERVKSKIKNIPTKAEANMASLLNKHEVTPTGLSPKEEDVFKYFRNLSKDIWRRENEVREKLDLPPIKYKTAYFRHTADAMAKEMLEGKYPFPQGIKYWSEKIVGKKIFNPMEFHRRLSDDLIDLWSKDIRAVTKAMLWNGLKEIHLAQPAKFLSEQLNAISKDLPEYKNLTPSEQKAYDQTEVIPASTKKWLIDYINQVIKGQETELDASLNRIVTKSGLKGIFDKVLSPFGRAVGRKPITNIFSLSGRMVISGVMGWVPRQIIRNAFQQVQNLALYGVQATLKSFLPNSVDKNLKGLLSESLFMKSYTGFEELPVDLMGKLEKAWLTPYGIVAINNAKQGMKAAYWNISELIKNPKFKKYGWADPQRTKDTPKGLLYPSEKEKLLKEMEFGASATQYQYIPMGMPGIFRYKAGIPFTRLQSWWMNYFTKFLREATHRGLKGKPSWSGEDGPTLPWSRRVNFLKYLIIGGAILTAMGYKKSFLLGVAPTYLSPAAQLALGFYNYATAKSDWQKKRALNQIYYCWKAFIPGSLAWRDFLAVWNGEKELNEILFYGKKETEKKKEPTVIGKPSTSNKITIPKINKIKINKISPVKVKF